MNLSDQAFEALAEVYYRWKDVYNLLDEHELDHGFADLFETVGMVLFELDGSDTASE
jgi:hypothetical protein